MELIPIAHIHNDFTGKFGIPRQSGLTDRMMSSIRFCDGYAVPEAVRGLDGFSHIWLIWMFSENAAAGWNPTVRPPRLGGNRRLGVFATRSPFRPNPIGLSCVKLERVDTESGRPVLTVSGADLMDGTPILDIKPYVPYADSIPEASGGFTEGSQVPCLNVEFSCDTSCLLTAGRKDALKSVLSRDPRPAYHTDPERIYKMDFGSDTVSFKVQDGTVTVTQIFPKTV